VDVVRTADAERLVDGNPHPRHAHLGCPPPPHYLGEEETGAHVGAPRADVDVLGAEDNVETANSKHLKLLDIVVEPSKRGDGMVKSP